MKMGKFTNLLQGKGKDIKIGDYEFTIKPLVSKHLGLFLEIEDNKAEAMYEMVLVSLQQSHADITMEDVHEIPFKEMSNIMSIITEVNELGE